MSQPSTPAFADLTDSVLPGIALMLGFCITAPLIDVASKLAAVNIPVGQITTARFIVQGAIMAPVCLWLGYSLRLDMRLLGKLSLRAVLLILSTYCFVAAIQVMPIADALAIVFVEPFIILLIGKLVFAEQVGPRRIIASILGFGGSLLVIQPSFTAFGMVALYPLGTALFFAFYMLVTRSLSRRMHPVPMQLHTSIVAALICLPVMIVAEIGDISPLDPVMPVGIDWLWLVAVGAASALSHLMMSYALRYAPSSTLAPLHYLEIVTAVILGYTVFGDLPNTLTFLGIGVIVGAGLYIFMRERALSHQTRGAKATT